MLLLNNLFRYQFTADMKNLKQPQFLFLPDLRNCNNEIELDIQKGNRFSDIFYRVDNEMWQA